MVGAPQAAPVSLEGLQVPSQYHPNLHRPAPHASPSLAIGTQTRAMAQALGDIQAALGGDKGSDADGG